LLEQHNISKGLRAQEDVALTNASLLNWWRPEYEIALPTQCDSSAYIAEANAHVLFNKAHAHANRLQIRNVCKATLGYVTVIQQLHCQVTRKGSRSETFARPRQEHLQGHAGNIHLSDCIA